MKKSKNEEKSKSPEQETKKTKPEEGEKSKNLKSEKFEEREKEKEKLPPFPKRKDGHDDEDISTGSPTEDEEESDFLPLDIEEFCQDIAGMFGEIAHIISSKIRPLDAKEKNLIGKPMSRVIVKHKLDRACKEEFLLIGAAGYIVYKRMKEVNEAEKKEKKEEKK